jgi:hypothetical protein
MTDYVQIEKWWEIAMSAYLVVSPSVAHLEGAALTPDLIVIS